MAQQPQAAPQAQPMSRPTDPMAQFRPQAAQPQAQPMNQSPLATASWPTPTAPGQRYLVADRQPGQDIYGRPVDGPPPTLDDINSGRYTDGIGGQRSFGWTEQARRDRNNTQTRQAEDASIYAPYAPTVEQTQAQNTALREAQMRAEMQARQAQDQTQGQAYGQIPGQNQQTNMGLLRRSPWLQSQMGDSQSLASVSNGLLG